MDQKCLFRSHYGHLDEHINFLTCLSPTLPNLVPLTSFQPSHDLLRSNRKERLRRNSSIKIHFK